MDNIVQYKAINMDTFSSHVYAVDTLTASQAAEILIEFNLWRRGEGKYDDVMGEPTSFDIPPQSIGLAIDKAIEVLGGLCLDGCCCG